MKKIYHLSTCDTNKKMLAAMDTQDFELIDIKTNPLTAKELEELKVLAGSYEKLFSRRAQLYKKLNLKGKNLTEEDYKKYLLEHYTFLQRPVVVDGDFISIGSSPKTKDLLFTKYGKK